MEFALRVIPKLSVAWKQCTGQRRGELTVSGASSSHGQCKEGTERWSVHVTSTYNQCGPESKIPQLFKCHPN